MAKNTDSNKPASKVDAKKAEPSKPAAAPAKKVPSPMELILAKQAEKKAAKAQGRPAPSAKTLGAPQGGSPGSHMNTHAKGGASGVARRTAPGG